MYGALSYRCFHKEVTNPCCAVSAENKLPRLIWCKWVCLNLKIIISRLGMLLYFLGYFWMIAGSALREAMGCSWSVSDWTCVLNRWHQGNSLHLSWGSLQLIFSYGIDFCWGWYFPFKKYLEALRVRNLFCTNALVLVGIELIFFLVV